MLCLESIVLFMLLHNYCFIASTHSLLLIVHYGLASGLF